MFTRLTLTALAIGAVSAWLAAVQLTSDAQARENASAVVVTPEAYCRAETDRTFYNATKLAGGVNRFFHFRTVTPLDNQTVVRMNRDTLYSPAVVDTSKGGHIACAGAWGLPPNEHVVKFNYNAGLPAKGHHTATYQVPDPIRLFH